MGMSIFNFARIEQQQLARFVKHWLKRNGECPEHFPIVFPSDNAGAWDEQLAAFGEEQGAPEDDELLPASALSRLTQDEISTALLAHKSAKGTAEERMQAALEAALVLIAARGRGETVCPTSGLRCAPRSHPASF